MFFILLSPIFFIFLQKKWTTAILFFVLLSLPYYATDCMKPYGLWAIAPFYYFTGCILGYYCFDEFAKSGTSISYPPIMITLISIVVLMLEAKEIISMCVMVRQLIVIGFALSFWRLLDVLCNRVEEHSYMNHNFVIYAIHPFIQALIIKIFINILPKTGQSAVIIYILTAILTICIIVLCGEFLRKKSPRLYSIFSGGR